MNKHIQYTLALKCAKNRVDIFSNFLDIRQKVEWPGFLAHTVCSPFLKKPCLVHLHFLIVLSAWLKFSQVGRSPPTWLFQNPRWPLAAEVVRQNLPTIIIIPIESLEW